jgi:hypothetical protein
MAPLIPILIAAAGAIAFAASKKPVAAAPPATHKPKKKAPAVKAGSEAAIVAAMKSPAAIKAIIDKAAASGDPSTLWNLGRTMLLNSKGNPTMQAAANAVLIKAVAMAAQQGQLGDLAATALANGDAAILARAAQQAAQANPQFAAQLTQLATQLLRAGTPPSSPGQPTKQDISDKTAAQAATQVLVDAVKQTGQVMTDPASAPLPTGGKVTTLPEVIITPGPDFDPTAQVLDEKTTAAQKLTEYLAPLSRYKEDKKRVAKYQKDMGLSSDGNYGPGTASFIAQLGIVPKLPFYWTKGKAQAQKNAYRAVINDSANRFPGLAWDSALKGLEQS